MSFWYLTCLGIPGLLVWIQGPETFFNCSTMSCPLVSCGLQTWLLQWQTSFFLWICWLSPSLKGSVSARSPYRELVPCLVEIEIIVLQSEYGCCARTPQWVEGCTSRFAIHWWIGGGTSWAPGWCVLFLCLSGDAKLWRRTVVYLVAYTVP